MLYTYFKKTIESGKGINVTEMAQRIGLYHVRGVLTDAHADELYALLTEHANPESNRPEIQVTMQALNSRIEEIATQLKELQEAVAALGGEVAPPAADDTTDDYPAWEPWDGLSRNYCYGDIVRHNGQLWISDWLYQNTWEPGVLGTEKMWKAYTEPVEENEAQE